MIVEFRLGTLPWKKIKKKVLDTLMMYASMIEQIKTDRSNMFHFRRK